MQVGGAAANERACGDDPSAAGHGVGAAIVPGAVVAVASLATLPTVVGAPPGATVVDDVAATVFLLLPWLKNQMPNAISSARTMPP